MLFVIYYLWGDRDHQLIMQNIRFLLQGSQACKQSLVGSSTLIITVARLPVNSHPLLQLTKSS
jgi:hypothetical protein